jgi:hypothetical protein
MSRTETVSRNFRSGPKIPCGLVMVATEITANSVNTADEKQKANEAYYQTIKKQRSDLLPSN